MKKLSIFIVLLLFGMAILGAQTIGEYTYSTSTHGSLQDMTGSTALLTVGTYYDDTASAVVNIGFNFKFGGVYYTQFSANSNGQMQLGATAISGGSASPSANTARIAPLSGDNCIRATGKLHYLVTGTSPTRKLIVEWLDLRVPYSSSTETGTYCRMQAWLYEGSNKIDFVYGTMWNMSTSAASRGIYYATGVTAGALGQILTINTTPTYSNTATSITNTSFTASSAMTNLNSAADGSRTVFTFTCPAATAMPNPATLTYPSDGGYAIIGTTLSWVPGSTSGGAYVDSYDVYFGTSSTPPFIQNQIINTYAPTMVAGTTYYLQIVPRNSFGAATGCPIWSFKTPTATQVQESFENTAFPPTGWANPGTWSRSTTYFKQGVASAYKYGSSTAQYILSLPKVTITGTSNIDLWTLASTTTGTLQIVYSPDRTTWTQIGTDITHAATYTWYNRVIDLSSLAGNNYYLGIRTGLQAASFYVDLVIAPEITPEVPGPATQTAPADAAIDVNAYTTFTWTAPTTGGVPTGYKIYCDGNTNPGTLVATITNPATLTYTLTTALNYNTLYYWKVVAYNGAGDSTGNTVRSFTTWANPTVTVFPWTESFDGTTFAPLGWGNTATVGAVIWDRQTAGTSPTCTPYSGAGMARYNSYSSTAGNKAELATPPLAVPAGQTYRVKFWMYRDSGYATYNNEVVNVYVNTSPAAAGGTLLGTISRYYGFAPVEATANAWYQYTFVFTGSAANKHLVFEAVSQFGNNIFIDHVLVEPVPTNPILVVTPSELTWDFGASLINTPYTKQYTVANNGSGTITLNSVTASGTYYSITVPPSDLSLTASESTSFTVQYLPTVVGGPYTGSVTIAYTSSTRTDYVISLSGTCFDPRVTLPYTENFDGPTPSLTISPAASWVIGTPLKTYLNAAYSAPNALITRSLTATYTSNENSTVSLQVNTTPLSSDIIVEFMQKFVTETGWDGMVFEYSIDHMATWTKWDAIVGTGVNFNTATSQFWYNSTSTSGPITPPKWSGSNSGSLYQDDVNGWIPSYTIIPYSLFGSAGNLSLRWHFGSDSSGEYEGIAIDDISIRQVLAEPPAPAVLVAPANAATNVNYYTASLVWAPGETGGIPSGYEGWLSTEPGAATDYNTLMAGDWFESTGTTIAMSAIPGHTWNYSTTYYWGILPSNSWGAADPEDPAFQIFSFTTVADPAIISLPHTQNFDGVTTPALPLGWSKIVTANNTYAYVQTATSTPQSAPNNVGFYNSSDSAPTLILATPQITVGISNIKLSFYARWYSYASNVIVGTMSDPTNAATFTAFSTITLTSTNALYSVNFAAYAGTNQFIAFKMAPSTTYAYMYLDSVQMDQLLANDLAATDIVGPAMGVAGVQNTYYITVLNNGTSTHTVYNIHLKRYGDDRLASIPGNFSLAPDASHTFTINWIPATSGSYNLVGEVELSGDGNATNNETTKIIAATVYPAGTFIPEIGDIASTAYANYIPIDVFYKNSLNETIYLPQEMQCTSGTIQAIIFQNNFTQDLTKEIKVWMMNTTATDLAAAYLDPASYILVADVMVHFPIGVNAVIIPLDTPFVYTGGNLAVRTYRVWESVYWASTNYFYYTADPDHPNRNRYFYTDGNGPIDPFALTYYPGDGTTFTGTASNYIPNTAFVLSPATPITALAAPVVTPTIVAGVPVLNWPAVPGAYAYRVYESIDPYSWGSIPIATVHTNTYTQAVSPFKFYKIVAITTYRDNDPSLILNPASAVGFDNSKVRVEPAIPNQEKK